ncbi:MAG: hypothetical protein ACPGYL_04765, partial [Rhodospirillaceae bacterium]
MTDPSAAGQPRDVAQDSGTAPSRPDTASSPAPSDGVETGSGSSASAGQASAERDPKPSSARWASDPIDGSRSKPPPGSEPPPGTELDRPKPSWSDSDSAGGSKRWTAPRPTEWETPEPREYYRSSAEDYGTRPPYGSSEGRSDSYRRYGLADDPPPTSAPQPGAAPQPGHPAPQGGVPPGSAPSEVAPQTIPGPSGHAMPSAAGSNAMAVPPIPINDGNRGMIRFLTLGAAALTLFWVVLFGLYLNANVGFENLFLYQPLEIGGILSGLMIPVLA